MDFSTLQDAVTEAYRDVFGQIDDGPWRHPVRFWAFVPGIHDDLGTGLDRYMAFNAGRHSAFSSRLGTPSQFDQSVPTASGVGIDGDRLMIACLAGVQPGQHVENPRQRPAYHYSRRFGPLPPCFARATVVRGEAGERVLLVGGTASITGEESRHPDDMDRQAGETFRNLTSLVAAAEGRPLVDPPSVLDMAATLTHFREVRAYYRRVGDHAAVASIVGAMFSRACRIELRLAPLCRRELLIEIEGVAMLGSCGSGH